MADQLKSAMLHRLQKNHEREVDNMLFHHTQQLVAMKKRHIEQRIQLQNIFDNNAYSSGHCSPADTASCAIDERKQHGQTCVDIKPGIKEGACTMNERSSESAKDDTKKQKTIDKCVPPLLAEEIMGRTKSVASQGHRFQEGAHDWSSIQTTKTEWKTLSEEHSANSISFDDINESINQISRDVPKHSSKNSKRHNRKCPDEQGDFPRDESNEEWNEEKHLLHKSCQDHTDRIIDDTKLIDDDHLGMCFTAYFNEQMERSPLWRMRIKSHSASGL